MAEVAKAGGAQWRLLDANARAPYVAICNEERPHAEFIPPQGYGNGAIPVGKFKSIRLTITVQ